ncbi:MAG: ATP-dependent Clp protease ATP-binding subunit [Rhodospirillales bacterium]|nr:ATP-dependent Clp protease ATP-binding subunit [Rhodospirillales bacterium]MCB9995242.1 ATP-dependent Clp protease ATP-binding subunit [Rhodospirillales bacterium]
MAVAKKREFADILAERGVMTHGLANDLDYCAKYGIKDPWIIKDTGNSIGKMEQIQVDLIGELSKAIRSLKKNDYNSFGMPQDDGFDAPVENDDLERNAKDKAKQELLREISATMDALHRDTENRDDPEYMALRKYLSESLIQELIDEGTFAHGVTGAVDEELLSEVMHIISMKVLTPGEKKPLHILEKMDANPLDKPSPLKVVDMMLMTAPPFYKKLLHRNGLLTDDTEMQDELASQFPGSFIERVALSALEVAKDAGSRMVDERHLTMALFSEPELQVHLHDLGVKDLLEFRDTLAKKMFKAELEDESSIRVYPEVTSEFKGYIWQLEKFCSEHKKDKHLPSRVFREVFNDSPEVDTALKESGLLRRMVRGWVKPYGQESVSEEEEKKQKPFEIDDEQFEALVAEYCVDFTRLASQKKFDPIIGNDHVLDDVETTLLKRGKKNPIVIGEAGVGKTKIMEGHAQRVVSGKIAKKLIGSRLLSLDLHSINTSPFVGVFESRILPILKGAAERNASGRFPPIQIAIDEMGNAMDAGAHSKGEGIKGMIKPYLTTGDLFVIGATTMDEYQTKIQKDGALARRFNKIIVNPPSVEETVQILTQLKSRFVKHHGLRIPNKLVAKTVDFAERYIHEVNHPDKSLDLFDHACAIAVKAGAKTLGEEHLVKATSVASNIPENFLKGDERIRFANLEGDLNEVVFDQPEAVKAVSSSLQRAKAGLRSNPEAPIGTFLFVGPTGVGKTELTRAVTRNLFGSEDFLTRFDMAEFQEKHTISRLIGSPPGYEGNAEGGGLVNAVLQKPYSVLLYDEVEKAHKDVFNVLLRPFDSGMVTDGRGRTANMHNTINIMTSNIGAKEVMERGRELGLNPVDDAEEWQAMARPIYEAAVEAYFSPEFLNRLDGVIYFNSLSKPTMERLVDIQLKQTTEQVRANHHGLELELAPQFRTAAMQKGYDVRYGARPLKRAWQDIVSGPLSHFLLNQNERSLKRNNKLIVSCNDVPPIDYDAMLEQAINDMDDRGNIHDRVHQLHAEIERTQAIVPQFKLER